MHTTTPAKTTTTMPHVTIACCDNCFVRPVIKEKGLWCGHAICQVCQKNRLVDDRYLNRPGCQVCWKSHENFFCQKCRKDCSRCECSTLFVAPQSKEVHYVEPPVKEVSHCLICLDENTKERLALLQCCRQSLHFACLQAWQKVSQLNQCLHCQKPNTTMLQIDASLYQLLTTLYPADPDGILSWMKDNPTHGLRDFAKGYYPESIYQQLYPESETLSQPLHPAA